MLGEELQRSRTAVQSLIRAAVRAGLVHMKDSGNGKRYGYRGDRGEIIEAFGFDRAGTSSLTSPPPAGSSRLAGDTCA